MSSRGAKTVWHTLKPHYEVLEYNLLVWNYHISNKDADDALLFSLKHEYLELAVYLVETEDADANLKENSYVRPHHSHLPFHRTQLLRSHALLRCVRGSYQAAKSVVACTEYLEGSPCQP